MVGLLVYLRDFPADLRNSLCNRAGLGWIRSRVDQNRKLLINNALWIRRRRHCDIGTGLA